jgi:hypothetical protein
MLMYNGVYKDERQARGREKREHPDARKQGSEQKCTEVLARDTKHLKTASRASRGRCEDRAHDKEARGSTQASRSLQG